ncbi:MAG: enoyl-CoA hydratase/isomerase family protein [Casimicrobiaceae bacterium]
MSSPAALPPAEPVAIDERAAMNGRRIGFARLTRPRQMNALNVEMCDRLLVQLPAWASDESIACVVLDAEGDRAFCSGGDVVTMMRAVLAGGPRRHAWADRQFASEYRLVEMMFEYPKPLLTWAHGITMGAGLGMSVAGSHRVVSPGARLAMPETRIGLFPDVAATWFLDRMPAGVGPFVALTGAVMGEHDALEARLADWSIDLAQRDEVYASLATLDWCGDAHDDAARLAAALATYATPVEQLVPGNLPERRAALARIGQARTVTQFLALVAHEARTDPWIDAQAASLAAGSPTSVHVGFEHFRRMRGRSLRETLAADLALARMFTRGHDFPEGVRAALIDKDRQPKWAFRSVDAVPQAAVDAYFNGRT